MSVKPSCWDSQEDWEVWCELNKLACTNWPPDYYCVDCTPDFQARRIEEQRCAYPTVTFIPVVERYRDPMTGHLSNIIRGNVRGKRSLVDEAKWQARFRNRKDEEDDG